MNDGLTVRNLRKTFPVPGGARLEVLRGVSFAASRGEIVAIMGQSGAGKSTLLHLLGNLEAADSGIIQLGDFEINQAQSFDHSRFPSRQVGFVFQFHHLLPDLTAAENVAMPLMIARVGHDESTRQAKDALERFGLGDRLSQRISNLSGGEQQRVAVARALITNPQLILADEPTGNLDKSIGDEIGASLVEYCRARGAVGVIATHNERLAQVCDRVLVLKDGSLESA